jgi:hypothetical protein
MSKEKNNIEILLEKELGGYYKFCETSYYNDSILRFITFYFHQYSETIPYELLDVIAKYNWEIKVFNVKNEWLYLIVENNNFTVTCEEYNSIGQLK